ncbi:MAG: chemotaxis protein CheW, partial [Nitrospinota bacterium]
METDNSLRNEFIEEALEHLSTVEEGVLHLENSGFDKDVINKVFRSVHTVKGGSGFFDLNEVFSLSHLLEDLLQKIRDGVIGFESKHITPVLRSVDALITMLENAPAVPEGLDIPGTEGMLKELLNISPGAASPPEPENTQDESPEPVAEESLTSQFGIPEEVVQALNPERSVYKVTLDLGKIAGAKELTGSGLLKHIEQFGKMLHSDNPVEALDKKGSGSADLFIESNWDEEIFSEVLNLPGQSITVIRKPVLHPPGAPPSQKTPPAKPKPDVEESKESIPAAARGSAAAAESIRIMVDLLDKIMTLVGEIVLSRNQLLQVLQDKKNNTILMEHSLRVTELQDHIMRTRLQPVGSVFSKFKRIVRDIAGKVGKNIKLSLTGEHVELDRSIIEGLSDPLVHLIRNSADHGLETPEEREKAGKAAVCNISLRAMNEGGHVLIQLEDDGKGINLEKIKVKSVEKGLITEDDGQKMSDKEIANLIFAPGFSTCENVSDLSGRGVGMDVVKSSFEKHGGSVELETALGEGTCISARLPLTLAIIPSLILAVEKLKFAIPQVDVVEIVRLKGSDKKRKIEAIEGQSVYRLRDKLLPVVRLADILGISRVFKENGTNEEKIDRRKKIHDRRDEIEKSADDGTNRRASKDRRAQDLIKRLIVLRHGKNFFGLLVDRLLDPEEIVVKTKPIHIEACKAYSGASVMGDGSIAMVLHVSGLVHLSGFRFKGIEKKSNEYAERQYRKKMEEEQRFIIVKNSKTELFTLPLSMISRVEKIHVNEIEKVGEKEFFQVKEKSFELIRIENYIDVAPGNRDVEELFLLIPRAIDQNIGIVATEIVAVREASVEINQDLLNVPGLLGSTVFDGNMTVVLDLHGLVDLVFPDKKGGEIGGAQPAVDGRGRRILLVEDTPFFRTLERNFFESEGFEVIEAEDGKKGVETLKEEGYRFDMIVSDIEMPVMNGYEFVRHVKADPEASHIPVVALTALASTESRKKGLEAGFD